MTESIFEEKIKIYIKRKGLNQKVLAEDHLNINPSTLNKWIKGINPIPAEDLNRICNILEVSRPEQVELFKLKGMDIDQIQAPPQIGKFLPLKFPDWEPLMRSIPAGGFIMGSDPEEANDVHTSEQPKHLRYLPDYYLSETCITNDQYGQFVKATGYEPPWDTGKTPTKEQSVFPVVNVSWFDAYYYCKWLEEKTGRPYRIPTEFQWEKGARGTDGRTYPWGNEWMEGHCNSREVWPNKIKSVYENEKWASPFGILDTCGNVWEWTCSAFRPYLRSGGEEYSLPPEDTQTEYVLKGGSFFNNKNEVRCSVRWSSLPINRQPNRGFRVAIWG